MSARVGKVLTLEDRKKIQALYEAGVSISEIACQVNASRSTIYAELKKCPTGHYDAVEADSRVKASNKRLSYEDRQTIQRLMESGALLAEIAETVNVSRSTLYAELRRCPPDHYNALEAQCTIR